MADSSLCHVEDVTVCLINLEVTPAGFRQMLQVSVEEGELRKNLCLLRLAGEFLKPNYLFVAVGQVGGACTDVQQSVLQVGQYSKREKLVEVLRNTGTSRRRNGVFSRLWFPKITVRIGVSFNKCFHHFPFSYSCFYGGFYGSVFSVNCIVV